MSEKWHAISGVAPNCFGLLGCPCGMRLFGCFLKRRNDCARLVAMATHGWELQSGRMTTARHLNWKTPRSTRPARLNGGKKYKNSLGKSQAIEKASTFHASGSGNQDTNLWHLLLHTITNYILFCPKFLELAPIRYHQKNVVMPGLPGHLIFPVCEPGSTTVH